MTKLAPSGCHSTRVEDGYQLCARCGKILCVGESVEVVYRGDRGTWRGYVYSSGPDWCGIYTHPEGPSCGRGNASGWRAVERAIDRREFNLATSREAKSVFLWGSVLPFVSLLDNKQLDLERDAVDYYGKEKLESEQGEEADEKPFLPECDIKFAHQSSQVSEDAYIRLLDRSILGKWALVDRRVTQIARKALYVIRSRRWLERSAPFEFYFPGKDKRYVLEERPGNVTREVRSRGWTTLQRINQGSALSNDNGHAVEYALYSRCAVFATREGEAFPYPPPSAKVPTDVDYEAERDALTRIARYAGVSEKKIDKALQVTSNVGLAEEIGKKDKKGKLREKEKLDELAVYRLSPPPQQFPLPFDSKQFPERYRWHLPKTDFRCPYCRKAFELANTYCPHCGQRTTPEERAKTLIDWAVRDFKEDSNRKAKRWPPLYEPGAELKTAFMSALNANFQASQPERLYRHVVSSSWA